MTSFWDTRYEQKEYAYGTEPNEFFRSCLAAYKIEGSILLPAEGEGRNAVYAAGQGLDVDAFDTSSVGRDKALALAEERKVSIRYDLHGFDTYSAKKKYDCIALIYAHLSSKQRSIGYRNISDALREGGLLIVEGFAESHLQYKEKNADAGGPGKRDLLLTKEGLLDDFSGLEVLELEEKEVILREGAFHQGASKVLRFVGRRRKR